MVVGRRGSIDLAQKVLALPLSQRSSQEGLGARKLAPHLGRRHEQFGGKGPRRALLLAPLRFP